jgi:phosphoglycolate phosphatase
MKNDNKVAIFFDLDGTLWDALVPLMDSWNEAMKNNGKKYRFDMKTMKSFMGLTPEETARIGFSDVDLKEGMRLFNICLDAEIAYLAKHPGKIYPNERETLELLMNKYPLYIISNCGKGYIEDYLNALDMNKYFTGHVCIGDTGLEKWQNIKYLQKREGIDRVIYIGDTLKDKVESDKAGVDFIHAAYGFGVINNYEFSIDSLDQLDSRITEVLGKAH